jgi:hypothetical protein
MSKPNFYRGLPVIFACQFKTTDIAPLPIDITGYTQLAIYARTGTNAAIPMVVQIVNAALGSFSAVIADTAKLTLGEYAIQADYYDLSGTRQVSSIGAFILVESVRYG